LPYPKDFNYRISGVLFDCFAFKKRFISTSVPIFKYYINKYPGIGETFDNIDEFQEILFQISKEPMGYFSPEAGSYDSNFFDVIQKDYSNEHIEEELQEIIENGDNPSNV
jgi:hypothetical protein